jgi:Ca2+/Na+ antiporter
VQNASLFALFFGIAWMIYAIRGIWQRKIKTHPRSIPGLIHEGKAAVLQGIVEFLIGFVFFAIGLVLYMAS